MIFGSDNMTGASQQVLDAILEANSGKVSSYGADPWTAEAEKMLADIFEHDLAVFFVATGTAANSLALSAFARPFDAILCHRHSHVMEDESTAPEFFSGGARLIAVEGGESKITAAALERTLDRLPADSVHSVRPAVLSVAQVSEHGLVYRPEEIAELAAVARSRGVSLHLDGARFANALVSVGCTPAELSWKCGVDVLCLGASKNGALAAEAVIFFDRERAADFALRRKRGGHLLSKGRFLGAQFTGWLRGGHWLDLARSANRSAARLSAGLRAFPEVRVVWPVEANEVFAIFPRSLDERLRAAGCYYYEWDSNALPEDQPVAADEMLARMVASFATTDQDIEQFLAIARSALAAAGS